MLTPANITCVTPGIRLKSSFIIPLIAFLGIFSSNGECNMMFYRIGCIFSIFLKDHSGEKVFQVHHDGGLAMMSMMTSTMTGEKDTCPERLWPLTMEMMTSTMTGGIDTYPER